MDIQNTPMQATIALEAQIPPDLQRYRRCIDEGCGALESAASWLAEGEGADERLEKAQEEFDSIVGSLIAGNPRAVELEQHLIDQQARCDLAWRELEIAKSKARQSFAAAYRARPEEGKSMLSGRITISVRRSRVGHWDPAAAAAEGKALTEKNPALFDTLFAPVKSGFKKLLGMGIPISPKTMEIEETVVVSFQGGDEMLRRFHKSRVEPTPGCLPVAAPGLSERNRHSPAADDPGEMVFAGEVGAYSIASGRRDRR